LKGNCCLLLTSRLVRPDIDDGDNEVVHHIDNNVGGVERVWKGVGEEKLVVKRVGREGGLSGVSCRRLASLSADSWSVRCDDHDQHSRLHNTSGRAFGLISSIDQAVTKEPAYLQATK
jgi:hypothetical protein